MEQNNAQRWLAVPAGPDTVRLIPVEGCGVDVFVKSNDHDRLRDAVEWVIRDASYKAPEQIDAEITERWLARLKSALEPSDSADEGKK